ncbi:MAG: nitroreductase family protein [Bacteroidaceae bacterium]|nr:nitroreductase family protein [Bacteroidaceae bacterium]MBR0432281.1 nitroreductase family protein [Bacteroidaceae bacterium]
MESFAELMRLRRSMRKFTDERLSSEDVAQLLKSALMSPSSKGKHAWHFVVVDDREMLEKLSMCKAQGADFLSGAAMAIVVVGDPSESDVWIEDASVASTVLLYQAEDLGLGACWIQVRERYTAEGEPADNIVRFLLNIPEPLRVVSIVAVGHKGMERKPFNEDRLLWDKVHVDRF